MTRISQPGYTSSEVKHAKAFLSDARQPEVRFSLLVKSCLDATKFVWLSVLTLIETICPKHVGKTGRLSMQRLF